MFVLVLQKAGISHPVLQEELPSIAEDHGEDAAKVAGTKGAFKRLLEALLEWPWGVTGPSAAVGGPFTMRVVTWVHSGARLRWL